MASRVQSHLYLAAMSLLLLSKAWAASGSWGPWSECSKACDGVQQREWQCREEDTCQNTKAPETRKCNEHGCLTQEMLFAIIGVGGMIVLFLIIILIVCIRRRRTKEKLIRKQQSKRYPETAENGGSRKSSNGRRKSFHRFPLQGEQGTEGEVEVKPNVEMRVHSVQAVSRAPGIDVFEAVNPNYSESIQEAQAIFGPEEPHGLRLDLESSSAASTESGSSRSSVSSEDENEALPPIIYTEVEIVPREAKKD